MALNIECTPPLIPRFQDPLNPSTQHHQGPARLNGSGAQVPAAVAHTIDKATMHAVIASYLDKNFSRTNQETNAGTRIGNGIISVSGLVVSPFSRLAELAECVCATALAVV
jgi:hypothetical protein